ncbi:hypothetical protein [Filimonas effusa]|uniref:BZIP transcription factor n=1 Tax=Filimonas effusa TaxID=2508721 RepID=A0A4Q1DBM1_9BACT|nr:hypothetical protein [Filimonas effusa]RXK85909.1 hypothetical protein ESB13_03610 [Filimonas effusa]
MIKKIILFVFIAFCVNANAQNHFPDSGYVGIGTTTPQAPLDVKPTGDEQISMILARLPEGNNNGWGTNLNVRTGDWYARPRPFWIEHSFYSTTNGAIGFFRGNNVKEGDMVFCSYNGYEVMWVQPNGNISIGLRSHQARLAVNGNILARKTLVKVTGWPDYVFEKNYKRMPLLQLAGFIEKHAHLPGVPNAAEVEAAAADIGATQKVLLEKLEEISLYLIELDKENKELDEQNKRLKRELLSLQ